MRSLALLILGVVALAGCSQPASDAPAQAEDSGAATATNAADTSDAPGFEMKPGFYAITSNGMILAKTRLNPDLTYIDYDRQNVRVGGGTWEADGASFCLNPRGDDGEEREQRCWKNGVAGEDGSFATTLSDGSEEYVIVPLNE